LSFFGEMRPDDLLRKLDEVEELLRSGVTGHFDRAERLFVSIARGAPSGELSNLAMKALSAWTASPRRDTAGSAAEVLSEALSRLRVALLEAKKRSEV